MMLTDSGINDVLKSLNHEIRREILRILHSKRNSIPYSTFMDELNLPASSNVAYHILLLSKSGLIDKNTEGRYSLTPLGQRSALLLDMVSENESSVFSDIYLGFSRLNPLEILLGTWWIFFFVLGLSIFNYNFIIGIFCIMVSIVSILLIIYRTGTLWTFLLINNFIWIFFAPNKRHLLLIIILTNIVGLMILELNIDILSPFFIIKIGIGGLLIVLSVLISIKYIYDTKDEILK